MKSLDEQWEEIARDAISEAEKVKCPIEDFLEGLRQIEIAIRERRELG